MSTNLTGITLRTGVLSIGNLASQPIPFSRVSSAPVVTVTPIAPIGAPPAVATGIQQGITPALTIPTFGSFGGLTQQTITQTFATPRFVGAPALPVSVPPAIQIARSDLTVRDPNEERLSLANVKVQNGQFVIQGSYGISISRPEIVGLMNFEPIYSGNSFDLNDVGLLLDTQYQARHLREQTFLQLITNIQSTDTTQQIKILQQDFAQSFNRINSVVDFYLHTIVIIENIKDGLDIKSIPTTSFNVRDFRTLRTYYETFMQFPHDALDGFSNTKILMQLLFDLRSISEGYSMNLISLSDPDRQEGGPAVTSPVFIDKTYNTTSGFTFTYDTIRSFTQAENASTQTFFQRFLGSLPALADDRTKIALSILSKEIRISRALGRTPVQTTLRQKFGATTTDGSPFDNIIGTVGTTIFDPIFGDKSLASLMVINDTANSAVFPFESKYIDVSNTNKVYVPGSSFFIDSILDTTTGTFNTDPLREFVEQCVDTIDNSAQVFSTVFDFGSTVSTLSPTNMFKSMLGKIVRGLAQMGTTQQINTSETAVVSIFKLAATDPQLKLMLFQYVLLRMISQPGDNRILINGIISNLDNNINNLSFLVVNDTSEESPDLHDTNSLPRFLDRLVGVIQAKVVNLVQRTSIQDTQSAVQTQQRSNSTEARLIVQFDTDVTNGIGDALKKSSIMTGIVQFMAGLETTLGNEANSFLNTSQKTRFNSLSVSTLALLAFEAYANLLTRYADSEFQAARTQDVNFPDMSVNRQFNDRMVEMMNGIISDPETPLPVIEPNVPITAASLGIQVTVQGNTRLNLQANSSTQLVDQTGRIAQETNADAQDVHNGILGNLPVLTGRNASTGDGFAAISDTILSRITNHTDPQDLLDTQNLSRSLDSISHKIFEEDFAVACAVHILLVIKKRLRSTLDGTLNYFIPQTLQSFVNLNATSTQDIGRNLIPAQVRLLAKQRDNYVSSLTTPTNTFQFTQSSLTDEEIRNALLSLLARSEFRETTEAKERYRILTVGIPAGFSKNLVERINGTNATTVSFQRSKSNDVIYINVYRRSLEFPELVFKPKKVIFDISLFPDDYSGLGIQPNENIDNVIQRMDLLDYQTLPTPSKLDINSIVDNDRYDFISDPALKQAIVENHILSDLFEKYVQYTTSMNLAETTFLDQTSFTYKNLSTTTTIDFSPRFAELVRRYLIDKRTQDLRSNPSLSPLPNIPIDQMLVSTTVDQSTKDTLKLLKFGNIAFNVDKARINTLTPKLFDRVFTIPLNVDDFEIDFDKTTSTETGKSFFEKEVVSQHKLDSTTPDGVYKLKPRTHESFVFEDFFTTIELVEEQQQ